MTITEIENAAKLFTFVGGFSLWRPSVRVKRDSGVSVLWLEIEIPDSTDPECRRMQPLNTGVELNSITLARKGGPERLIADELARFFMHEFYESILVDGERLFDPHVAAAYHPGAL